MNTIANITSMSNPKLARFMAMWMGCAIVFASINPSFAQSTDRDSPTPLTTKILSNPGEQNRDTVYYYSLIAKPGKITITLDSDVGSKDTLVTTSVKIQTLDGQSIESIFNGSRKGNPTRTVKRVEFPSETPVLLVITSGGYHKIKIDGDWTQSGSASTPAVVTTPTKPESKPDNPVVTFGGERHQTM
jgi:hypothetical protein